MPFGLKNMGVTYQRLVNLMFVNLIGKIIEVYIDDMLVMSMRADQHLDYLRQAFQVLEEYNMKPNPSKFSFGVVVGKFLGYLVTEIGAEVDPNQIRSINNIGQTERKRDIQRPTDHLAALNRFIPISSEIYRPFFWILKKNVLLK